MEINIKLETSSTSLNIRLEGTSWEAVKQMSFYAAEIEIQEIVKSIGLELTRKLMEAKGHAAEKKEAEVGILSCKNTPSPGHYQTLYGSLSVNRHLYQSSEGGKTFCPLEAACQLKFGSATPLLAELIAFKISSQTPAEIREDLHKSHRLDLSAHYLSDLGHSVGAIALHQVQEPPMSLPEPSRVAMRVIATGMDGTTMPIVGEAYKEAMSGTIAFYDAQGERQTTQYLGTMPQKGKSTFKQRFLQQVQQVLQAYPQAFHVCLGDGAPFNWNFMEAVFPQAVPILDFYHACEHLQVIFEILWGPQPPSAREEYAAWRETLKEQPHGIEELITLFRMALSLPLTKSQRKRLLTELGYFLHNAHRMRYWYYLMAGYPIGSGVTEAACKELIKARFGRSGMRWKRETGAKILQLRAIKLSKQWDLFWKEVMNLEQAA